MTDRLHPRRAICLLAISLAACATQQSATQGYSGPTALIADTVQVRTESVANVYALQEVDGRPIANAFGASSQASQGQGFRLSSRAVEREVPAVPLKLRLKAQPITGAPIQAMAMKMAGTLYTVEGVVAFTPQAGARYVVRGELKKEAATVWIEDAATGQVVTEKLTQVP